MFQHLTFTFIFNITPYVLMKINTTDPPEFMEWRYLIATHTSGLPPRVNKDIDAPTPGNVGLWPSIPGQCKIMVVKMCRQHPMYHV